MVIKYAPPFVAVIGEDAPFGTFRQVSTGHSTLQSRIPTPSLSLRSSLAAPPYFGMLTPESLALDHRIPGLIFARVHAQLHIC